MRNRTIANVVDRLIAAVDAENEHLRAGKLDNLDQFAVRKSHALVELSRAISSHDIRSLSSALKEQILHLKQALSTNESLLQVRAEAVRELSGIVRDAMRAMESDGTYSGNVTPRARPE